MNVNRYQFESIAAKTKKTIVPIKRGEEDGIYFEYLALLEIELYQFHQKFGINGRQAKEILNLVLFDIKAIIEQEEYDCTRWEEPCYRKCADTLETLFLPEKNPALREMLEDPYELDNSYFDLARKSIVRIYESVEQWTKTLGTNGYFQFIQDYIGSEINSSKKFLVEDQYLKI